MKRAFLVVGLALLAVAGCSNSPSGGEAGNAAPLPDDLPACTDLFQAGKVISRDEFGRACRQDGPEGEELAVPRYVALSCDDGSTLMWNEFAWGYDGLEMTLFDQAGAGEMPTERALECRRNAATTPTSPE